MKNTIMPKSLNPLPVVEQEGGRVRDATYQRELRRQARYYGRMARLFATGAIAREGLTPAKRVLVASSYAQAAAHCYLNLLDVKAMEEE